MSPAYSKIAERLKLKLNPCRPEDPPIKGKLFHYTTADGLIGIVRTGRLWATACEYLNDPEEWKYGVELTTAVLSRLSKEYGGPMLEAIKELSKTLDSGGLDSNNDWYITCFCNEGDLLEQWRSYAEGGGGYCIEFDTPVVQSWAEAHVSRLIEVIYQRRKQREQLTSRLRCALSGLAADLKTNTGSMRLWRTAAETQLRTIVLPLIGQFKHPSFESEGERRLGYLLGSGGIKADFSDLSARPGRGFVVPYLPLEINRGDGRLPLLSVRCGPTTHPSLGKAGVTALLQQHGYWSVSVNSSSVPYRP